MPKEKRLSKRQLHFLKNLPGWIEAIPHVTPLLVLVINQKLAYRCFMRFMLILFSIFGDSHWARAEDWLLKTKCESQLVSSAHSAPFKVTQEGRILLQPIVKNAIIQSSIQALARHSIYPLLAIDKLEAVGTKLMSDQSSGNHFWKRLFEAFELNLHTEPSSLDMIPNSGPLVVVANHPLNGIEGIAIAAVIARLRQDVKIVMTPLLEAVPGMPAHAIFLDPYGSKEARKYNLAALRQMTEHLAKGGALVVFPAGEVSTKQDPSDKFPLDSTWRIGTFELFKNVRNLAVLPVFAGGTPGPAFHRMKHLEARLNPGPARVAWSASTHVRSIGTQVGSSLELKFGPLLSGEKLAGMGEARKVMGTLRASVYELGGIFKGTDALASLPLMNFSEARTRREPLARDLPADLIEADLQTWVAEGKAHIIGEVRNTLTYLVDGEAMFGRNGIDPSNAGLQLGKIREETFWPIGEGTGLSRDIDRFDPWFKQILIWDKETRQIIAGQRVGQIAELMSQQGLRGVYSAQFFSGRFYDLLQSGGRLNGGIEVGRTFVLPAFQGTRPPALFLIWKAMGHLIEKSNWEIQYFTGVASIPASYRPRSLKLIKEYIMRFHASPDAQYIIPSMPFDAAAALTREDIRFLQSKPTLKDLDQYVSELESGPGRIARGVPPLLQNYLDLGAKILGCNFDKDFNSLDFAIEVHVPTAPVSRLKFYFGSAENVQVYLKRHGIKSP